MCSWNVKALALGCITAPTPQMVGLSTWFGHAADEFDEGETPDPARVAEKPIKLNAPRTEVMTTPRHTSKRLDEAIRLEQDGYPLLAHDELAKLVNDKEMLPRPDQNRVAAEEARR